VRTVHVGPLTVLPGVAGLLAALDATVGLGVPALATGGVLMVLLWLLLEHGLRREGLARLGPANAVTLVRAGLVVAITALVVQSWSDDVPRALLVALSSVALVLDLVDGRLARARGTVTALGAAFDMETDAFLILVLSVYVVPIAGAWVLLIGLARYLLLLATAAWPWLGEPVPTRPWAKVVAAVQGVVLVVAAAEVLPTGWAQALLAAALLLLLESFGRQVVTLGRQRHQGARSRSPLVRPVLDVVALALVWLALVLPQRPQQLTAAALLGIPVELLVFLVLALVLPPVWGRVLAIVGGVLLTVTVVVTVLDLGFYEAFDRPFNPLTDPSYLGSGLDLLHASAGRGGEAVALAGIVLLLLGGAALCVWAAVRTRRTVRAAPRAWSRAIAGLAVVWLVAGVGGARVSGVSIAGTPAASLVASQVDQVRAELHDRVAFEQAMAHDAYALTPGRDLLTRLRGKDVLVVFVESYGRVAVEDSWFAPQVDRTLTGATAQLGRFGFQARSGWLGSPTFGGISWLAHSTLQSGLWIDSQQRYDQVLGTDRLTLAWAFRKAGWRTVDDVPSNWHAWPEGQRFYHYHRMYGSYDVGYAGPRLGYARVPDQYTLRAFDDHELRARHRPVMAEIDLDSSHTPWTSIPRLVPWNALGDGAIYDSVRGAGVPYDTSLLSTLAHPRAQQTRYARSIRYSLRSLVSFVHHAHDKNLVMVVLGDHQPNAAVSGNGASHDVPVSLIAHDPAVLRHISRWGWTSGLQPATTTPTVPMNEFRDRFLAAFGSRSTTP
jgi:phosphatidylglycerophosphate synthase